MYFAEVKHGYFEHGKAFEAKIFPIFFEEWDWM